VNFTFYLYCRSVWDWAIKELKIFKCLFMCSNDKSFIFLSYKKLLDIQKVAEEYLSSNCSQYDNSSNSGKAHTTERVCGVHKTQENAAYNIELGCTFKSPTQKPLFLMLAKIY
jgi:hypothetical protein